MKRLDIVIASRYSLSRSFAATLIKEQKVLVGGTVVSLPSKKIAEETEIYINPQDMVSDVVPVHLIPQPIPLDILYEDRDVIVINKQAGISVHPSISEPDNTIVNALMHHYSQLQDEFGVENIRPGIVHRLDKETSGVLIAAKNRATQAFLTKQFKERMVYKEYFAIVQGKIERKVTVDKAIARNRKERKKMAIDIHGKEAFTAFEPQRIYRKDIHTYFTALFAFPKTGRTHQIRVHLKSLGYPIVGDELYHGYTNDHMLLHAQMLRIALPGKGMREFIAERPSYFDEFLAALHEIDTR